MTKSRDKDFAIKSFTIRNIENTLERLQCLHYYSSTTSTSTSTIPNTDSNSQRRHIIAPNQFLLPASILGTNENMNANAANQFNLYIDVIQFLICTIEIETRKQQNNGTATATATATNDANSNANSVTPFHTEEYEDPNHIAQKLMLSLRSLHYEMDFSIAKLKIPFGDIACSILDFLSNRAMTVKGYVFEDVRYVSLNNDNGGDEDASSEGEDEEISEGDGDGVLDETRYLGEGEYGHDHENGTEVRDEHISNNDADVNTNADVDDAIDAPNPNAEDEKSNGSAIAAKPKIDLMEWRKELERVGPLLDSQIYFEGKKNVSTGAGASTSKISTLSRSPRRRAGGSGGFSSGFNGSNWRNQFETILLENSKFETEFTASQSAFERLCKESNSTLAQVEADEDAIHDLFYETIGKEHALLSNKIHSLEQDRQKSSHDLKSARDELQAVTHHLEDVKEMVEEKGKSITDTSQLVRIKTTLQDMKAEIRDFDLEIGVLEHTLLHKRLRLRVHA